MVPKPGDLPQPSGSCLDRYWVNKKVSPDPSERCSGTTAVPGRFTPGLSAAICGSSQVLMVPWYMAARTFPFSLRCSLTPGRL
ncbi:Uncharacterised protein [Mycobacterium tuberculosis]|nr:Uncharacterised protein [Mycobacterium tuberculosis]COX07652.1 Uncharacterised protein [Mycobacterium tuberculosis]